MLNYQPVKPAIHLEFGKAVHKIVECYWEGKPYLRAFEEGFKIAQALDIRLLTSAEQTKWNALLDSLAPTATIYYGRYGNEWETNPATVNEKLVEWPHGIQTGLLSFDEVTLHGTIDRVRGTTLTDTKTASAVGKEWRTEFKRHHLREPQLWFYLRYCEYAGIPIDRVGYEVIVKSYRGSDPDIEIIDCSKEVFAMREKMNQQIDWAIREIVTFTENCKDVAPWPMNSGTGCFTKYSACDYEPVCGQRVSLKDGTLYKIKEVNEPIGVVK